MEHLNEWQEVWRSAKVDDLPEKEEILKTIKKYKAIKQRKLWIMTILAGVCTLLIPYFFMSYRAHFLTTTIGACLMLITTVPLLISKIRSLMRTYRQSGLSNAGYLEYLQRVEQARTRYYKRTRPVVAVISTVGVGLCYYELVYPHWLTGIIVYGLLAAWLVYCWAVLGPRSFKRNRRERMAIIEKLKALSQQMGNEPSP